MANLRKAILPLLVHLLTYSPTQAQVATGTLTGVVTDVSGGVVQGAVIEVTDGATRESTKIAPAAMTLTGSLMNSLGPGPPFNPGFGPLIEVQ
jgi:hypothetical protein